MKGIIYKGRKYIILIIKKKEKPMGELDKTLEEGNKQFPGGSGKFFSFEEGDNRIRIVSPLQVFGRHYIQGIGYKVCIGKEKGCKYCANGNKPAATYFCWVIDRREKKVTIKEAEFGYTVLKGINDVTGIEEYKFELSVDGIWPYDLNIRMIEGKKKNEKRTYNTLPLTPSVLDKETIEEIIKKKHPMEIIENKKVKEMAEGGIDNKEDEEKNIEEAVEEIPF